MPGRSRCAVSDAGAHATGQRPAARTTREARPGASRALGRVAPAVHATREHLTASLPRAAPHCLGAPGRRARRRAAPQPFPSRDARARAPRGRAAPSRPRRTRARPKARPKGRLARLAPPGCPRRLILKDARVRRGAARCPAVLGACDGWAWDSPRAAPHYLGAPGRRARAVLGARDDWARDSRAQPRTASAPRGAARGAARCPAVLGACDGWARDSRARPRAARRVAGRSGVLPSVGSFAVPRLDSGVRSKAPRRGLIPRTPPTHTNSPGTHPSSGSPSCARDRHRPRG